MPDMPQVPSDDAINEFVAITKTTRDHATSLLQANNLDANQALNAFFESNSGQPPQNQWPVSSEPEPKPPGYPTENVQKSFNIDRGDSYTAPPSRPPSRIGHRSALERVRAQETDGAASYRKDFSHRIQVSSIDLPLAQSQHKMTLEEREEHDMQQAVAASLSRSFDRAGQESGVVSARGTQFGPANRDYYDNASWAMTTYNDPTPRQPCMHPDPEERKRENGFPAFCRPLASAEYLGACITILHSIPLSREAFISRNRLIPDYGHHPFWWNGEPIDTPPTGNDSQSRNSDKVFVEAQRLMAFLDGTTRAFGTITSLVDILTSGRNRPEKVLPEFLEQWQREAFLKNRNQPSSNLFESTLLTKSSNPQPQISRFPFCVAEMEFEPDENETLYDVIDNFLWQGTPPNKPHSTWLGKIAPIFTMRLRVSGKTTRPVGVKIPATWYPDRYLEANQGFVQELRERRLDAEADLEKLKDLIEDYSTAILPGGQATPFKTLLENAIAGTNKVVKGTRTDTSADSSDDTWETILTAEETEKLVGDLKSLAEKIDRRLATLSQKEQQVKESLKRFSKSLTEKDDDSEKPPHHKYTLRGVSTHPHLMYVLKRVPGAKNMRDIFPDMTFENEWEWWRISFSVEDGKNTTHRPIQDPLRVSRSDGSSYLLDRTKPRILIPNHQEPYGYTITPARELEVLQAAKEDHSSVLLVYANEDAVQYEGAELPEPLQAFLDADNQAFEDEIRRMQVRFEKELKEFQDGVTEEFVEDIDLRSASSSELNYIEEEDEGQGQEGGGEEEMNIEPDRRVPPAA
ncbi:predicted protein [Uncinocarpus reesii 1704]|uniref:Ubiquitin interaction motif protein n=1 Tax=Uncinocarpus reesii (strain UAMH 1704) TaxID=336963 RepID=C4JLG5_UNCRE|nr:uncharacterized protein UREG_03673 [Uncinocarpus reesii 1704]EEP78827.1 predicted protein [Uncinocarpus reesii 1704]